MNYNVSTTNDADMINECLKLRYQIFAVEKEFEWGKDGLETDRCDPRSRHVLLTDDTGSPIATARVVYDRPFPMEEVCSPDWFAGLPSTIGEISRFSVLRSHRKQETIRLGLMQGILKISVDLGLTHWCAIMEPMLLRLLERSGIHFTPLGPMIEHHGLRQPCYADIREVLERTKQQGENWNYVTMDGSLLPAQ